MIQDSFLKSFRETKSPFITNPYRFAAGDVGGWVELGRTTLGSTTSTIDVTSLSDKRYYMFLADFELAAYGGQDDPLRTGNGSFDTGNNYATRRSINGGSDGTSTSTEGLWGSGATGMGAGESCLIVGYAANLSGEEKLFQWHTTTRSGSGAGNAPDRMENTGKWINTSNPLDRLRVGYGGSNTYATDSELVVLGWDPSDTHTNNFWEELASVDLSGGAADQISSGTFTNKKYLWVQAYLEGSGAINNRITWNNVTTSTYAFRYSADGAGDVTVTSQANIQPNATTTSMFMNFFIVNDGSNEPLLIGHEVEQSTAGAGNAPSRSEFVGKSSGTTAITEIDIDNSLGGSYGTNTILKVWGSN